MHIKINTFLCLIFLFTRLEAQVNICDCASYTRLLGKNEYKQIFPPNLISENKVKELLFMTEVSEFGNDSTKILNEKYNEILFKFDKNGFVNEIVWYSRKGIPHSKYTFKRDVNNGYIRNKTFSYLDESGNQTIMNLTHISDYSYDKRGNVIKIKNRGFKGEINSDSLSSYHTFEYDDLNRLVKTYSHLYFDWTDNSENTTKIRYNDKNLTSITEISHNNFLMLSTETSYDSEWKVLKRKSFNHSFKEYTSEEANEYDGMNRIKYHSKKSFKKGVSECPDDGNFEEHYEYENNGILEKISHKYLNYECKLTSKIN